MIEGPEDARAAVDACLYPPSGHRSLGPVRVGNGIGAVEDRGWTPDYFHRLDAVQVDESGDLPEVGLAPSVVHA